MTLLHPVRRELAATVATPARVALLVATMLVGVVAALLRAPGTVAEVAGAVHATMSVPLPFLGILLVVRARAAGPTVAACVVVALAVAVWGDLVTVVVADRSDGAGAVVAGSVVVAVLTMLCGLGCGLLLRRRAVAVVADVVVPLGAWAVTGALGARTLQRWATPYGVVPDLLAGGPAASTWARAGVVLMVWGVLPLLVGLYRVRPAAARA